MNDVNKKLKLIRPIGENDVSPVSQTISIRCGDLIFSHSWQACEQNWQREVKININTLLSPVQKCYDEDGFALSANNVWTKFDLQKPYVIKRIEFAHAPETINIRRFTFEGSHDDNKWNFLSRLTNSAVKIEEKPTFWSFEFNNNTAYRYYRCVINEILTTGIGDKDIIQYPVWGEFYLYCNTVEVTDVSIKSALLNIRVGETHELDYEVEPANNAINIITWSSSNPAVAAVDIKGVVTALKTGTAVITVRSAKNASIFDTCLVAVEEADETSDSVTGIEIII